MGIAAIRGFGGSCLETCCCKQNNTGGVYVDGERVNLRQAHVRPVYVDNGCEWDMGRFWVLRSGLKASPAVDPHPREASEFLWSGLPTSSEASW